MPESKIGVNLETFYKDHWVKIDAERLDRAERQFAWRPERAPLLEPADIQEGHTVLDFGCGPGHQSLELARRVGDAGFVHGVDINQDFISRATQHAAKAGLADHVQFHHVIDEQLPLDNDTVDRVFVKSVLLYVPDLHKTLVEFYRVLRPGGLLHTVHQDWNFSIMNPWSAHEIAEFVTAATAAFREPNIGRKLPLALKRAGYENIDVRIIASVDTTGSPLPALRNMASYIRKFKTMNASKLDDLMRRLANAAENDELLMIRPWFLVTGSA